VIVVSDSGPLIALSKIKHLDILEKFFGEIIIPEAVWIEVVEKGEGRPGAQDVKVSPWIKVNKVKNKIGIEALKHEIGIGESEAIILAMELNANIVLIDDKIARGIAESMGLKVAGTLSIIYEAINNKVINENFKEIIQIMRKKNIWISDEIIDIFEKDGLQI
jgi:predicted nucleic acid-binding protein